MFYDKNNIKKGKQILIARLAIAIVDSLATDDEADAENSSS